LRASETVETDLRSQNIRLLQNSHQPLSGSEHQLAYLTQNLGDHFDAATDNVIGHVPPHFERAVRYSDLSGSQVAELQATFDAAQMALLKRLSKRAADMKKESGPHPMAVPSPKCPMLRGCPLSIIAILRGTSFADPELAFG